MKRLAMGAGLLLLVLATPSNQTANFNGLPWGSPIELAALSVLLFVLLHQNLRTCLTLQLEKMRRPRIFFVGGLLGVLVVAKSLLFFTVPTSGAFEVCYQSESGLSSDTCSRTFEPVPMLAGRSEHFERRSTAVSKIQFESREPSGSGLSQSNWRLPFVNSWEFDDGWRMWNTDDQNIEVFPFRAKFKASLEVQQNEIVRVSYVGEGTVTLGKFSILLPPAYSLPNEVRLSGSGRNELFEVNYSFARSESYGNSTSLPYAALSVDLGEGDKFHPLEPSTGILLRTLNFLADALTLGLFAGLLLLVRRSRSEVAKSMVLVVILLIGVAIGANSVIRGILPFEAQFLILVLLTLIGIKRRWPVSRLSPSYLVVAVTFVRDEMYFAVGQHVALNHILVRLRGNDHLVYHAHVREMLVSGFLRGGENVYYFQPGIRYYFYLQNVLFGESGFITGVVSVALVGLGILVVATRLTSESRYLRIAQRLGVIGLLIWWSSSHTTQSTIFGLSEFGTWIVLIAITGMMLKTTSNYQLAIIGSLAGIATWIRPNQGLAMIGLVVLAAILFEHHRLFDIKRMVIGLGTLLAVLLLMPLHNLIYGKVIAFQPVGAVVAQQLTWTEIFGVFSNRDTRQFLMSNLQAALYLPSFLSDIYSYRLALGFLTFFVVVAMVFPTALRSKERWGNAVVGLLIVVGQVIPFLKFNIVRYHPIQIIAIHLSLVLMALLVSHSRKRQGIVRTPQL